MAEMGRQSVVLKYNNEDVENETLRSQYCNDTAPSVPNSSTPDVRSVLVTSVLNLEKLDTDLYRGKHYWIPSTQRLFGGEIISQALGAASETVTGQLSVHSLHCYFVRPGDPSVPVLYQVERTRDGRSFSVRSVKAIQHDKPILMCQASFHAHQPSPLAHQYTMPTVPPPEDLLTMEELVQQYASDHNLAERDRRALNKVLDPEVPLEIKPVNMPAFSRRIAIEPRKLLWVRAKGHIGEGDMRQHCCVAAYVSDYSFLGTAVLPYADFKPQFSASLDHAMWFHNSFRTDEWMLYEIDSSWAGHSRGLVHGRLWRQDGVLAASSAQEGLLRMVPSESKL
ncbi:hypothetical protein ACEWY4_013027 [Coilia grayii]|uniref:Acyl-coenzyme A thioesterase 8 n=1 Tax=Coilia grayii TaxID=363190 RepID=A0ABD1JV74_9TELE